MADQNWTLVQQNGAISAPASNETPRLIKGDDPYVAGSSLIRMNEEMIRKQNGGPVSHRQTYYKTEVEKTLEQNQNVDAFERARKISNTSDASRAAYRGGVVNSAGRFERATEVRESGRSNQSYQKPRLANIQVSQSKQSEASFRNSYPSNRVYLPEKNDSSRSVQTTVYKKTSSSQPYRIPEEDYSGIQMYSEQDRYAWRAPAQTQTSTDQTHASLHRLSDTKKVKNLTERFETTEVGPDDAAAASRSAVENELREQLAERRSYQKSDVVPMSPRRISRDSQILQDYDYGYNPSTNWQGRSGKATIETRVNRIKKVGAVSVFPD